jgi:K+-transporting ATPase ATPase C chain
MNENKIRKPRMLGPAIRTVVLMLAVVGVTYPLVLVVIGQGMFPVQSNGSMVALDNGSVVGSLLIAQEFTSPKFFHPRPAGETASGVDPHITPGDAFSQIDRVSEATAISENHLQTLIELNIERNRSTNLLAFAPDYVNVLDLNLQLVRQYPEIYDEFIGARQ